MSRRNVDWPRFSDGFLLVEGIVSDESLSDVGVVFNLEVTEDEDEDDERDDAYQQTNTDADECTESCCTWIRCGHNIARSLLSLGIAGVSREPITLHTVIHEKVAVHLWS